MLQSKLIPEVERTEITTLKQLNTKHLFEKKALKNLQLFTGECLDRGDSGASTFLSFTKAVAHLLSAHCSLLLATERIEAGIPTHPKYYWFLQSHAKCPSPGYRQLTWIEKEPLNFKAWEEKPTPLPAAHLQFLLIGSTSFTSPELTTLLTAWADIMAALILVALIPRAFLQQQQTPSSMQREAVHSWGKALGCPL